MRNVAARVFRYDWSATEQPFVHSVSRSFESWTNAAAVWPTLRLHRRGALPLGRALGVGAISPFFFSFSYSPYRVHLLLFFPVNKILYALAIQGGGLVGVPHPCCVGRILTPARDLIGTQSEAGASTLRRWTERSKQSSCTGTPICAVLKNTRKSALRDSPLPYAYMA